MDARMGSRMQTSDNTITLYSLVDYRQRFALTDEDLAESICDFNASLSSFNAQAHLQQGKVVSVDALYNKSAPEMQQFVEALSIDQLQGDELHVAHQFLVDYPLGLTEGRYVTPDKLRSDYAFALLLVISSEATPLQLADIQKMLKLAKEVRIFLDYAEVEALQVFLPEMMLRLQQDNVAVALQHVNVKSRADSLLCLQSQACDVEP